MGIRSIAVYSDADAGSLHLRACDSAVGIGGVSPRDSYLRSDLIIAAAKRSGAQAIHPGYGFLSENADFAQACFDAGITFVGPPPEAMRAVGDKIAAKKTAIAAGVAVLPGYMERAQTRDVLEAQARAIGVPLLIKAAAGGGGRGMRLVADLAALGAALDSAQREALAAFGDSTVFLERYLQSPRHIEVQIMADTHGTCIALGERECSIQRRYQKILEESPSPVVGVELRGRLEEAAVAISRAVGYTNAGTVEFMLDRDGRFYFLEMNARLQVEHPVTEMVTGVDLVRDQLVVASGGKLAIGKGGASGHAIEVRIYAEDPAHGFLPSSGHISTFELPQLQGVRHDVAIEAGSDVSPAYDPLLGKLIVHAPTRMEAIRRLAGALDHYLVGGVATNIAFLRWLVDQPAFKEGATSTDFLDRTFQPGALANARDAALAPQAAAGALQDLHRNLPGGLDAWQHLGGWRHSASPRQVHFATPQAVVEVQRIYTEGAWRCGGEGQEAIVQAQGSGAFTLRSGAEEQRFAAWPLPDGVALSLHGSVIRLSLAQPPSDAAQARRRHSGESVKGSVEAPMSGTIVKVNVKPGEAVKALQVLLVMEAMKMEHAIVAPYPGTLTALRTQVGHTVSAGDVLAEIAEV